MFAGAPDPDDTGVGVRHAATPCSHEPSLERPFRERLGAPAPVSPTDCRLLRDRLGWSAEQLASAAGVATPTVLSFELGRRRPREETLIALRRAFRNAGPAGTRPFEPEAGALTP